MTTLIKAAQAATVFLALYGAHELLHFKPEPCDLSLIGSVQNPGEHNERECVGHHQRDGFYTDAIWK